jgi:beta-1,4-mannosyl-glycoprotein beta-1,4-N-acetylglucosaminyltransferase
MQMIDCFTFYNEIDMLMYRLNTLYDVVDKFVLVEATLTHRGNEKPLYFKENKEKFGRFLDKIIHIIDDGLNPLPKVNPSVEWNDDVWKNENHQRNSIQEGLKQLSLNENDILIISDVDEIPNPNILRILREKNMKIDYLSLSQDMYYYNLTTLNYNKWFLAKVLSYSYYVDVLKYTPQLCRSLITKRCIENGGWHLSYFGDPHFIQNKLKQFAHQEFNNEKYTDLGEIQKRIQNKEDLFSRQNEKWIHLPIEQNNFLPPNYPSSWI